MGRFSHLLGGKPATERGRFAHLLEDNRDEITYKGIVGFDPEGNVVGAKPIPGGKPAYAKRENPLIRDPLGEEFKRAASGLGAVAAGGVMVSEAVHQPSDRPFMEDLKENPFGTIIKRGLKSTAAAILPRPDPETAKRALDYINAYERNQEDNLRNIQEVPGLGMDTTSAVLGMASMAPTPFAPGLKMLSEVVGGGVSPETAVAIDFLMESPDILIPSSKVAKGIASGGSRMLDGLSPKIAKEMLQDAFTEGMEDVAPKFSTSLVEKENARRAAMSAAKEAERSALVSGEKARVGSAIKSREMTGRALREEEKLLTGKAPKPLDPQLPGEVVLSSKDKGLDPLRSLLESTMNIGSEPESFGAEAMSHAGSDVSVEAISRVAKRERYARVTRDGRLIPIINDVAAVDVHVNPGEAKVRIKPSGAYEIEEGVLTEVGRRAVTKEAKAYSAVAPMERSLGQEGAFELAESADGADFLKGMGVEVMEPPMSPKRAGERLIEDAANEPPKVKFPKRKGEPQKAPLPELKDPLGDLGRWVHDNLLPEQLGNYKPFRTGSSSFRSTAARFVDPQIKKTISRSLPRMMETQQDAARAIMHEADGIAKDLNIAVKEFSKATGTPTTKLRELMSTARRTKNWEIVPEQLREIAQKPGQFVDGLSRQYEGIVPKETFKTFEENLGRYFYRSYETFDQEGFIETVKGTPAWDNAFSFLKGQAPDATDEEIIGMMYAIASKDKEAAANFARKSGVGRGRAVELIQRKEIADPLRELMGEHKDIFTSFAKTTENMATTLTTYKLHKQIADAGLAEGWLRQVPEGRVGDVGAFHQGFSFSRPSPLNDLHTVPEVKSLLMGIDDQLKLSGFSQLGGWVKYGKVVLSPKTQLRNFESGALMSLLAGRMHVAKGMVGGAAGFFATDDQPISTQFFATLAGFTGGMLYGMGKTGRANLKQAGRIGANVLTGNDREAFEMLSRAAIDGVRKDVDEVMRLGLVGHGAATADVLAYAEAIKIGGKIGRAKDLATKLYQMGDDFWRVFNYLEERDQLIKVNKRQLEIDPSLAMSDDVIRQEAAEIVKQQFQNYTRSLPIAKRLTTAPLVGNFVTFHMEMPRNLINTAKRALHEANMARQTGNPEWAKAASKRVIGMGTALFAWQFASEANKARLNVTDEQIEAMKLLTAAPWEENTYWIPVDVQPGGKMTFFDSSFSDPQNLFQRVTVGLTRPGPLTERLGRVIKEVGDTFFAPEIAATAVARAALNPGGEVRDESALPKFQIRDTAFELYRQLRPGILSDLDRQGIDPLGYFLREPSKRRDRDKTEEAISWVGPRIRRVDAQVSLGYKLRDSKTMLYGVTRNYNERMRGAKTEAEEHRAKDIALEEFNVHYDKVVRYLQAAQAVGISKSQAMKQSDLPRVVFNSAWHNRPLDYRRYRRSLGERF